MKVRPGPDGVLRCEWANGAPEYPPYHDQEWGWPVTNDRRLYEKLCLESFQSGLAWITVLRKREAFRRAFHQFEPAAVAAMGPDDVTRLLDDESIIRHRGKIESAINNAHRLLDLQATQSLASLVWSYEPAEPPPLAAQTPESAALAKDLKQRGFTWLGPTTVHAFMQAMGLVNDHLEGCHTKELCSEARARLTVPTKEWARDGT